MKSIDYEILKFLLEDQYVNSKVIAEKYKISIRTVRYSINRIRALLENYNCSLKYNNQKGYYFSKHDQILARVLVSEYISNKLPISTKSNRELYLKGLIIRNDELDINQIATELYISVSSIHQDCIKIVKAMPGVSIRSNIVDNQMNFEQRLIQVLNILIIESQVDPSIESTAIHLIFGKAYQSDNQKKLINLINTLPNTIDDKYVYFQAFGLLYYIFLENKLFNVETNNLLSCLNDKLSTETRGLVISCLFSIGVDLKTSKLSVNNEVFAFVKNIEDYYNIEMTTNTYEMRNLDTRVKAILIQVDNNIVFKYKHTSRVIRLYPYSFSISQQLLNSIGLSNHYSRDQVALVCEVIQKLLFESQNSKAIMFVTDYPSNIVAAYKQWIQSKYSKNIKIIEVLTSEFGQYITNHSEDIEFIVDFSADLIATTKTVIRGKEELSIEMLNSIDRMLSIENGNFVFFSDFLTQRMLKVYYNQITFEEQLYNCALALERNQTINDHQLYMQQCIERERIGTTYIGYKTMICHPLKYAANANALFFTILNEPILIEGYEVAIIINCAFKEIIDFDISRLFEIIMKIVENEKNIKSITASQSEMELYINIRNAVIKI